MTDIFHALEKEFKDVFESILYAEICQGAENSLDLSPQDVEQVLQNEHIYKTLCELIIQINHIQENLNVPYFNKCYLAHQIGL